MKRWAILVAALYCLILATLTVPVIALAFPEAGPSGIKTDLKQAAEIYSAWGYWAWLSVMVLAQAALLAVPVRFASRRPVTRGSLLPTVLASGLMMGGMVAGAIFAIYEVVKGKPDMPEWQAWSVLGVMALTWAIWSFIFFRQGRQENPADFISRQSRTLLKGSILELLVAVPTHIVARHRNECCAGMMTFIGLAMGISVMLFSFGPSVFFLFVARWKRLHPAAADSLEV
jgi:hypothetical protein